MQSRLLLSHFTVVRKIEKFVPMLEWRKSVRGRALIKNGTIIIFRFRRYQARGVCKSSTSAPKSVQTANVGRRPSPSPKVGHFVGVLLQLVTIVCTSSHVKTRIVAKCPFRDPTDHVRRNIPQGRASRNVRRLRRCWDPLLYVLLKAHAKFVTDNVTN